MSIFRSVCIYIYIHIYIDILVYTSINISFTYQKRLGEKCSKIPAHHVFRHPPKSTSCEPKSTNCRKASPGRRMAATSFLKPTKPWGRAGFPTLKILLQLVHCEGRWRHDFAVHFVPESLHMFATCLTILQPQIPVSKHMHFSQKRCKRKQQLFLNTRRHQFIFSKKICKCG